ncbi:Oidioi.mRNA.OKI2018_I69.chr1.g3396.t1.cds [Oikopleura dioica]|uniref:Oidioi.mRNA.OKI2018_I69.chr1.g3396.t1.cds n=1 Tax=Oikopleura dioica TaxID=34765 RepID=A0ABN7SY93_OIKDI|nr:Oidioi.mRNA.OKI2018_I69.chr1.g3396.t1.cds [Oikopleura dioica]
MYIRILGTRGGASQRYGTSLTDKVSDTNTNIAKVVEQTQQLSNFEEIAKMSKTTTKSCNIPATPSHCQNINFISSQWAEIEKLQNLTDEERSAKKNVKKVEVYKPEETEEKDDFQQFCWKSFVADKMYNEIMDEIKS